jgi:hypothetical protein
LDAGNVRLHLPRRGAIAGSLVPIFWCARRDGAQFGARAKCFDHVRTILAVPLWANDLGSAGSVITARASLASVSVEVQSAKSSGCCGEVAKSPSSAFRYLTRAEPGGENPGSSFSSQRRYDQGSLEHRSGNSVWAIVQILRRSRCLRPMPLPQSSGAQSYPGQIILLKQPLESVGRTVNSSQLQRPSPLYEAALHCVHHGFKAIVRPEFLVDAVQMIPQRRKGDPKLTRDLC